MAIADGTALYRIWGEADLLLYIGISDRFGARWREHAKKQPWWPEMRRLSVDQWFGKRADAKAAEEAAIRLEGPKYNKTHVGVPLYRSKPTALRHAVVLVNVEGLAPLPQAKEFARVAVGIARFRDLHPAIARRAEGRQCGSCNAAPGELCHTSTGRPAAYHVPRIHAR